MACVTLREVGLQFRELHKALRSEVRQRQCTMLQPGAAHTLHTG